MTPHDTHYRIFGRNKFLVNTDPQRRCYDGCHYKSELRLTEWYHLGTVETLADAGESIASWKKLNPKNEYTYVAPANQPVCQSLTKGRNLKFV